MAELLRGDASVPQAVHNSSDQPELVVFKVRLANKSMGIDFGKMG